MFDILVFIVYEDWKIVPDIIIRYLLSRKLRSEEQLRKSRERESVETIILWRVFGGTEIEENSGVICAR